MSNHVGSLWGNDEEQPKKGKEEQPQSKRMVAKTVWRW